MQAAIVGGGLWLWASDTSGDRPPLHVAVLMSVFVAYVVTFGTLMVTESVSLIARKARERHVRARHSAGQHLAAAARSHPERRGSS